MFGFHGRWKVTGMRKVGRDIEEVVAVSPGVKGSRVKHVRESKMASNVLCAVILTVVMDNSLYSTK